MRSKQKKGKKYDIDTSRENQLLMKEEAIMSETNEKNVEMIKLQGLKLSEEEQRLCQNAEIFIRALPDYNISWLGESGVTNSTLVSATYMGSSLWITAVVTGTPTWDTACTITAVPTNCKLKSGESKAVIAIHGGTLGTTHFLEVTPTDVYKGKTVTFSVSIRGADGAVFYASGSIG